MHGHTKKEMRTNFAHTSGAITVKSFQSAAVLHEITYNKYDMNFH